MNMTDKLKGLPPIIYLNLDERPDRREYTETQYEKYKIKTFTRYSTSKYQLNNFSEWKDKLILNDVDIDPRKSLHIIHCAITLTYLELMKHWLEMTNDQYVLLMEDDYDLSFIDYWHFDWQYLMNIIPYDWDCILLSFENDTMIPCFLHRILAKHSMGAALVTRSYVEKIIKSITTDGKFDLTKRVSNFQWTQCSRLLEPKWYHHAIRHHPNVTIDYIMGHSGVTYCLPLIAQSNTIGSYTKNIIRTSDFPGLHFTNRAVNLWWKKFRDSYSLEDFFLYGKPNDFIININNIDELENQ
jgi:hypothetical protein